MFARQTMNAEVLESHDEVFRRGGGIVGEEQERRARRIQGLHEINGPRNELILTVYDPVHINQVTCFHSLIFDQLHEIQCVCWNIRE